MINTDIKPSRSFVDPHFQDRSAAGQNLAILIGSDSCALAIQEEADNTVVFTEEYIFSVSKSDYQLAGELDRILSSGRFQSNFRKVVLSYSDPRSTLIPDSLFESGKRRQYFNFNFDGVDDTEIHDDHVVNLKARHVFMLPSRLESTCRQYFQKVSINHAASALLDGLILEFKQYGGDLVLIHVGYAHFEIIYLKQGSLQFFNSFQYTTSEDFVYYTLFVFEQLGLSGDATPVKIFGQLDENAPPVEMLKNYLRDVSFGSRSRLLNYSPALNTVPRHHYYNLYQLFLCAL